MKFNLDSTVCKYATDLLAAELDKNGKELVRYDSKLHDLTGISHTKSCSLLRMSKLKTQFKAYVENVLSYQGYLLCSIEVVYIRRFFLFPVQYLQIKAIKINCSVIGA